MNVASLLGADPVTASLLASPPSTPIEHALEKTLGNGAASPASPVSQKMHVLHDALMSKTTLTKVAFFAGAGLALYGALTDRKNPTLAGLGLAVLAGPLLGYELTHPTTPHV